MSNDPPNDQPNDPPSLFVAPDPVEVKKTNKQPKPTAHRIPDDWTLDAELERWCLERFDVDATDVTLEAEAFVDYWQAADGRNARKRDWRAAFRTWVRRSWERKRRPEPKPVAEGGNGRPRVDAEGFPISRPPPSDVQLVLYGPAKTTGELATADELAELRATMASALRGPT